MTKEELIQLRNQLAHHIFSRCNISDGHIDVTEATREIQLNEIRYKLGPWDNVKMPTIRLTLAQGKTFTDRDRRKNASAIRKQRENDSQIYLILSYEFEVGNTQRKSPQKQVSTRRFLYHYIRKTDTECINFKSKLETYKDGTRNIEISHINRWIAKKEICLGTQIAQINDGNIVKLNSDYIPDECIQTVQTMKALMEDGIVTYFSTNDPDELISDSIVSDLRGDSDIYDRIIIEAAKNAYESIFNTPYTGNDSFSDLFCSLEDKDKTNENSNKTDDNWEGAREELLKNIYEQIIPSNMSTNQKSKTDNQKFVNKMLSILFPNHKYIDETREEGPKFLQKLLENEFHTTVKILSTEPIYDTKGKKNLRSYAEPYAIEGTDYYVSSKWCWEGDSALKASKIITKLCNFPYVTEEARIKLQALNEQWKNGKLPDEEESSGYYILVADPKRFRFTDKEIGIEDSYSILNDEGKPRQKPWCYETAKAGDKLVCYEASPIQKVVAFGEVCEKNDTYLYFKKTINLPIHLTRSELLEDSDLKQVFQSPHGSLLDLTEAQYKKIQRMATKERNLIYFGAPGTGKSYLLKKEAERFEDSQSDTPIEIYSLTEYVERVTFHPEYTYFDFVGSYKPMMDGENIKYSFEPGPFARVLKKALSNPEKEYLLIIEEINRARVAAVFGDMFQLLDRNKNGQSEYFITPAKDLLAYLTTEEKDEAGNIIQQRAELEGGKLRLPANMFIWATMNSADQGVFPMDTAFKRRWSFKYVGIDESEKNIKGNCAEEWKTLRKRINQLLQEAGINEDKQLGPFFLKETELEDEERFKEAFAEKVIMYLFEDAARHHRSHIFKSANLRYSALTDEFNGTPDSIFNTPKEQDSTTSKSDSEKP